MVNLYIENLFLISILEMKSINNFPTTLGVDDQGESPLVYMVTIKCNHIRFTSIDELNGIYQWLVKKIQLADWHTEYAIELDSKRRLHLHGLFTRPKKVNPASYRKEGWTIHFQLCEDYDRAKNYMYKENQCKEMQQQREIQSYASYHNMFH